MADEELQHLIDRIQTEAVDTAEKQAAEILSKAKEKAADIVKKAEEKSRNNLAKAEQDAQVFTERSIKTLEQAGRDLLITVGQGVENILSDLAAEAVDEAMGMDVLKEMLVKVAEACAADPSESRIEFLVSKKDQDTLVKFFADRYRQKMAKGIKIHADEEILKGFKVSLVDDHVDHEFTHEAIAEALAKFLRPRLAEIVHRVAQEGAENGKKSEGGKKKAKKK